MNESGNKSPLTSPKTKKSKVKAIAQADGQTILFQKEVEPPPYDPLDDAIDEISDEGEIVEVANETDHDLDEESLANNFIEINEQGNPVSLLCDPISLNDASEDIPPVLTVNKNSDQNEQNEKDDESYSFKSSYSSTYSSTYSSKVSSRRQSPLIPSKSTDSKTPSKSPIPQSKKLPQKLNEPQQNLQKNPIIQSDSNFYVICGYCLLILSIILFIALYNQEAEDPQLRSNSAERELVFALNDCVSPIKTISAKTYSADFLRYIQKNSLYLMYNETDETIAAKKPLKSLFCKAVEFGDHHPDLGGMFIVWLIMFIFYIWYRISRSRAERIVPIVYNILENDNGHMCYIEDARKQIQSNGVSVFGAWWQVLSIINKNKNIKTVKMVDAKPFWSLNKN